MKDPQPGSERSPFLRLFRYLNQKRGFLKCGDRMGRDWDWACGRSLWLCSILAAHWAGEGRGGGGAGNGPVSDSQPTGEELNGDEAVLCTRVGPRVNSLAILDPSPH